MMAEKSHRRATQADAVRRIRQGETFALNLPVFGRVTVPHPEQVAYYGGLTLLAAFEIIDWPVAAVLAAGHILARNHRNQLFEELGEALEEA